MRFADTLGKIFGVERLDNSPLFTIEGKTGDTTHQVPYLDPTTHVLEGIAFPHAKVHKGDSFTCHYSLTTANTDDWYEHANKAA